MYYIAASVLNFFFSPLNQFILFLAAGFLVRSALIKKIFKITAICIFLIFSNRSLLEWYAGKWQPLPVNTSSLPAYSCGIVLGGFASPDADANGYFNSTSDRFIQTLKLYKTGKISRILISGGNGKPEQKSFHEAYWVKGELMSMGVPDSVIITEDRSDNTADNARYARIILDSLQLKPPYVLVTSALHMPRAALLFEKSGVPVIPFPCNYLDGRGDGDLWNFLPDVSVLSAWKPYLKETAGYAWYRMK